MNDLIDILEYPMYNLWAYRALLASMLVGLMCGVLGCFIVLRNMALIGDALAHAILPGVVFAYILVGYSAIGFFFGATAAGLLAAVGITWIQQNVKTKNDAAIGIVFTAMFSIGVIGISSLQHTHLDLKDFLFGNTMLVTNEDLGITIFVTFYVLLSVLVVYRYLFATTFQEVVAETMGIPVKVIHYFLMLLLSFAVVASLRTVGVILVVAMLITPASTALLLANRLPKVVVLSGIIGMLSAFLGLILAIIFETTPGPVMAIVATVFYLLAAIFSPQKGLLFKYIYQKRKQRKIRFEDVLKQSLKQMEREGSISKEKIKERLGLSLSAIQTNFNRLKRRGYLTQGKEILLTAAGTKAANRLVRAHRLWEVYLVQQMGMDAAHIHENAEKYEHLLTDELLDEMEEKLGYPTLDPHGAPIPKK